MKNTYVSIETVLQGSNEEPIIFRCDSMKQARHLANILKAAPEMYEELEKIHKFFEGEPRTQYAIAKVLKKARGGV